jgi:glutamate decarboxylase
VKIAKNSDHKIDPPGHPHFFNQLSTGLDVVSLAGEYLTATCNTNMFTYEIAPVFILMEHATFSKMREIIGFHHGDSIMAPGENNFLGLPTFF